MSKRTNVLAKLALRRETVRNLESLDDAALAQVAGGLATDGGAAIDNYHTRRTTNRK